MAEKASTVILVAVERGFRNGRMVEPGTEFPFSLIDAEGKERKPPKWAVPKGDAQAAAKRQPPKGGDLRPADAQAAAKGKRDALSENLV
jgi:hypothetical protein